MTRRTIRASEIGAYLFCKRAWWYQVSGQPSQNLREMSSGLDLHYRHGRAAFRIGCLRVVASALLLVSLVLLAAFWINQAL